MVSLDVFRPGEGVLVQPGGLVIPVDCTVDSLAGSGTFVTGVSLCTVELLPPSLVHIVASADLQFEIGSDVPGQRGICLKIVYDGLTVLVAHSLGRVETVVAAVADTLVNQIIQKRTRTHLGNRFGRAITPDGVHQPS